MSWTAEDWEGLLEPESQAARPEVPNQTLLEILRRIPDRGTMTAADFGCAAGECLPALAVHFGNVLAVAESEKTLGAARRGCPNENVRGAVCDFSDLSGFAGTIDVALAVDVPRLNSGASLDDFIEQLYGALVEGGILLMRVPAAKRMGGPVELHLGKHADHDLRSCYNEVELQYRLRRAGFQGLRIRRFEATADTPGTLLCMAVRRSLN